MDELERRLAALERRRPPLAANKYGVFEMREGETFEAAAARARAEGYGACLILPKIPQTEAEIERWSRRTVEYQELLAATARRICNETDVDARAISEYLRAEHERIMST